MILTLVLSSVSQTIRSAYNLLKPLATSLNLSLTSFGEAITDPTLPTYGSIVLSDPWNTKLESAPISPYRNSPAFRVLSGTIKGTYNAHRGLEGNENIMVYPSYLFGNTGKGFTTWRTYPLSCWRRYSILLGAVGKHLPV